MGGDENLLPQYTSWSFLFLGAPRHVALEEPSGLPFPASIKYFWYLLKLFSTFSSGTLTLLGAFPGTGASKPPNLSPNHSSLVFSVSRRTV